MDGQRLDLRTRRRPKSQKSDTNSNSGRYAYGEPYSSSFTNASSYTKRNTNAGANSFFKRFYNSN
jgi:hypothetical protein